MPEIPPLPQINIECLIEDYDYSGKILREVFEEICQPLMERLRKLIGGCLERCQFEDVSQMDSVEMIGGASRVPWIQRICQEMFKTQHLSKTLNADEAVVRGCALQAAIYSPIYRVRDYNVGFLGMFLEGGRDFDFLPTVLIIHCLLGGRGMGFLYGYRIGTPCASSVRIENPRQVLGWPRDYRGAPSRHGAR